MQKQEGEAGNGAIVFLALVYNLSITIECMIVKGDIL